MSNRAEERALEKYPKEDGKIWTSVFGTFEFDKNAPERRAFQEGYEQAEKDLTFMARVSSGPDGFYYGKGYEQAEKDLGWISVEDRLPKERGWYFTCINHYGTPQALGVTYYDGKEWLDDDDSTENVDYWMEVPKLPKDEENETK